MKKAKPKKSLNGVLMRRTFKGPSKAPYGGSLTFEMPGHHSKPTGGPAEGKHGSKRVKDIQVTPGEWKTEKKK